MRYKAIDKDLFIRNRENFSKRMKPNSIAIFRANEIMPRNADNYYQYKSNSSLFYLTGVDQEETMLVLFPDAPEADMREILFVRETNDMIATWEDAKLSKSEATARTGIETILWTGSIKASFQKLINQAEHIYLDTNEHSRYDKGITNGDLHFVREIQELHPLHKYERAAPILASLRSIKDPIEVAIMQEACNITEAGFKRLLGFVKPGVMEYEIEAELTHEFIRRGSRGHAYEPIIASGANACILHYITNNLPCHNGDMILLDFGAEYANYSSDLTRCIPVNGKFSPRQKEVYNAVLRVHYQAVNMLKPGIMIGEYQLAVGALVEAELIGLGLLNQEDIAAQDPKWPAYKRYFMHGTSHFLGLDTHDLGNFFEPIKEGMVFTVEPGIYIREEGIGVRIENNYLIQSTGNINLMANIPIEADEIEKLMQVSL